MNYDNIIDLPFERNAAIADRFNIWFESNEEWLECEYEEKHGEICDEEDMKKFKEYAADSYFEMTKEL